MKEAVIVSTARTGIGRAYKGALNHMKSPSMLAHAISHAMRRAGVEGAEIEDAVIGCVPTGGTAGMNLARNAVLAAGLPATVSGQTIDRQCASGLMAIATAAKQVMVDGMDIVIAGGHDNISAAQEAYMGWVAKKDPQLIAQAPNAYMPMLKTAGFVPFSTTIATVDKASKEVSYREVTLDRDEGNRPETSLEGLMSLKPVIEGGLVTAGNASQLSDGASACVVMERGLAERRGLAPLGIYRGISWPAVRPKRWESGQSTRFPNCSNSTGSRSTTSACGSSTKPSPARRCTAAITWASTPRNTT